MINWTALIVQLLQIAAGTALVATQSDPNLKQMGTVLIGTGIGQSFPQPFTRKDP